MRRRFASRCCADVHALHECLSLSLLLYCLQGFLVKFRRCAVKAEDFIPLYEQAIATQDWAAVDPLIHENACVTFSTGTVHVGKPAVRRAFEQNFSAIADEEYRISNVHWVQRGADVAVYLFDFNWTGRINGRAASGSGRGTCVLRRTDEMGWRLLVEHLGPGIS